MFHNEYFAKFLWESFDYYGSTIFTKDLIFLLRKAVGLDLVNITYRTKDIDGGEIVTYKFKW